MEGTTLGIHDGMCHGGREIVLMQCSMGRVYVWLGAYNSMLLVDTTKIKKKPCHLARRDVFPLAIYRGAAIQCPVTR